MDRSIGTRTQSPDRQYLHLPSFGSAKVTGFHSADLRDPTARSSLRRIATSEGSGALAAMQETVRRTERNGVVPAHTAPARGRPTKSKRGQTGAKSRGGGSAEARRRGNRHKSDHTYPYQHQHDACIYGKTISGTATRPPKAAASSPNEDMRVGAGGMRTHNQARNTKDATEHTFRMFPLPMR